MTRTRRELDLNSMFPELHVSSWRELDLNSAVNVAPPGSAITWLSSPDVGFGPLGSELREGDFFFRCLTLVNAVIILAKLFAITVCVL